MCNLSDLIEEKAEIRIATMMLKDGKEVDEVLQYVVILNREQLEEIKASLE